ncbi:MAG: ABC transporter ATP-binding protein [Elusimicrobiota bacterium]
MRAVTFVGDLFRKFPKLLIANTTLLLLANLVDAASIFTVAPVADLILHPDRRAMSAVTTNFLAVLARFGLPQTLECLLAIFLALFTMMNGFQILARHWILKTKYAVERDLYQDSLKDFFRARWCFFTSVNQGVLINTFLREIAIVGSAIGAMALFFAGLLQLGVYLAVPLYLSWKMTLICVGSAGVFALPFFFLGKTNYRLGQENTATGNTISTGIQESLALAKIILGFGNQAKNQRALAEAFDAHVTVTVKSQTLATAIPLLYQPFGVLVLVVAFVSSSRLGVPLAETAVLLFALFKIIPALGQLAAQKNSLDNFFPSYEQIQLLRERARALKQRSGAKPFTCLKVELALKGFTFSYPGHPPALSGLDVNIPRGKMVAFVGESGAGKSTLIDVIMGFNEPEKGSITCDGTPLHDFDIDSYRARIGYVPQDSVLFNGTIRENLLWAKADASEDELRQACRQAHAEEFITSLPLGYETLTGDRGVRLSGGQIQRVALARAILRKPDLLILDEATSSLDTRSERLIQEAIEAIAKDTTIVVIAHRLSTIINADYIYVLKNGRVVEKGTYQQLVRLDGQFNRMARLQVLESAKGEQG